MFVSLLSFLVITNNFWVSVSRPTGKITSEETTNRKVPKHELKALLFQSSSHSRRTKIIKRAIIAVLLKQIFNF